MEDRKISIISIIYRVEPYLKQCLESILSQTYRNLEILLVIGLDHEGRDDDNCLKICQEYANRDPRIRLLPCPARGIADARNVGLSNVTGDLIGFVDGDDWIEPDLFSHLEDELTEHDCQIAVCGRFYEFVGRTEADQPADTVVLSAQDSMRMILCGTGFFLHLWDKLFERSLWDGVRFPTDKVVEDRIMVGRILAKAEKICYNSTPRYHFRERSGSNSKKPGMAEHNAIANKELCAFVSETFGALKNETGAFYLQESITSLQNLLVAEGATKEQIETFTQTVRQVYEENRDNPLLTRTLRIKTMLSLHGRSILKWITAMHQRRDRDTWKRYP